MRLRMSLLVFLLIVDGGRGMNLTKEINDCSSNATRDQSIVPCSLAMRLSVSDTEASENDWDCRIALH